MAVIGIIVFCGGGDHLCGGVAAEPGRASEGSGRGPGAGRISYGMEQESWEE